MTEQTRISDETIAEVARRMRLSVAAVREDTFADDPDCPAPSLAWLARQSVDQIVDWMVLGYSNGQSQPS
jgi:hypothetical protein